MAKQKKATETTSKKKLDFIPKRKGNRILWSTNMRAKIQTHGPNLSLTGQEVTDSVNFIDGYTNTEAALDAVKVDAHNKSKAVKNALKAMTSDLRKKAKRMKNCNGYTDAIGKDLEIEGAEHLAHLDLYKPKIRKAFIDSGFVHILAMKGDAEAYNVYARLKGQTAWMLIGSKVKYTPFVDNRLLSTPNVPEEREYKLHGVFGDREIGLDSSIASIVYGG
ncbi:MAG: hypothetical protein HY063_09150 [Bacteroidetes bacterium]|nr:hypothetical protein [Bacteroidota bacterium]